jgi:hypothetical protein
MVQLLADPDDLDEGGGDIVLDADVDAQLLGDSPRWRRVTIVEGGAVAPGRADDRIVVTGTPMPVPAFGDPPDWADVPHPPTVDDGPVLVLHLLRYADAEASDATPDDMREYTAHAAKVAGPHGGRIAAWFAVGDTVVGDGRTWHQARFNAFPSKAAFMAVVLDPARLEAQRDHREVAIADTYTMILRPVIDRLAGSVDATS